LGAKIAPALKNWIDRVIVPGLVCQYLRERSRNDCPKFGLVATLAPATPEAPSTRRIVPRRRFQNGRVICAAKMGR